MQPLLEVRDLRTWFRSREGVVRAVDGVSFMLDHGKTLGIAGESGCGKSVTAQSILGIVPEPGSIQGGEILFQSERGVVDLAALDPEGADIRAIRGREIAMVFQEPMTSFSPVYTIGSQITEVIRLHQASSRSAAERQAIEMLARVGMPRAEQAIDAYPFHLSGGMRQRAMIAMALSCRPRLLIADEPTTALDVTIQAQILRLLRELQLELGMSLIIITHDMAVIAQLADRVLVMYLGKDVESGPVQEVFAAPRHPYAQGLLASMPRLGAGNRQFIEPIAGSVPNVHETPSGCAFHPRCPRFMPAVCDRAPPAVVVVGAAPSGSADGGHLARCFLYGDDRTAAAAARREPSTVIEDADGASFENRDQPAKRVHRF